MVMATAVDVAVIADIPANNLQVVLGTIYGKAVYAADNVGAALYDADYAKTLANNAQGTATWAGDTAGFVDYQIRALVNALHDQNLVLDFSIPISGGSRVAARAAAPEVPGERPVFEELVYNPPVKTEAAGS